MEYKEPVFGFRVGKRRLNDKLLSPPFQRLLFCCAQSMKAEIAHPVGFTEVGLNRSFYHHGRKIEETTKLCGTQ
jgi:hypothetical protein